MKLYRFSPIDSEPRLREAVSYITATATELCLRTVEEKYPITYLTVCAHYEDEYLSLLKIVSDWGTVGEANNGVRVTFTEPLNCDGHIIPFLRIRKPDPYRMQVGCVDFSVPGYEKFRQTNLESNPYLRLIERPDYEMVEFFHPDYDVLAYVVSD